MLILSEERDLARLRHAGKGAQRLELLDMGLGEFVAAGGKFLHGNKCFSLALLHSGQRRRLTQAMMTFTSSGGRFQFSVEKAYTVRYSTPIFLQ